MIKLINEELNIYSCGIADLTMDQVSSFLKLWNDGSTIGSLTVFYDTDGKIVINEGMRDFDNFKEAIVKYVEESEDVREQFKATLVSGSLRAIFVTLDAALRYRKKKAEQQVLIKKWEPIKIILEEQIGPSFESLKELREQFYNNKAIYAAIADIYNYGVIQGKRIERVKKKQQQCKITA